jgi:hypothetical protein
MKNSATPQTATKVPARSGQLTAEDTKMAVGPSAPPMMVVLKTGTSK